MTALTRHFDKWLADNFISSEDCSLSSKEARNLEEAFFEGVRAVAALVETVPENRADLIEVVALASLAEHASRRESW